MALASIEASLLSGFIFGYWYGGGRGELQTKKDYILDGTRRLFFGGFSAMIASSIYKDLIRPARPLLPLSIAAVITHAEWRLWIKKAEL